MWILLLEVTTVWEVTTIKPVCVPSKYEAYLQTEKFDRIRQAVFERDNFKCVVCGSTDAMQAHHLTYHNIYDEQTEDLITLCRTCHSIYHAVDKRREVIEEFYRAERIREQEERANEIEEKKQAYIKERDERIALSNAITSEIKAEYLSRDYCKNGDLDMMAWDVLNSIIKRKCNEHGLDYWIGDKCALQRYFLYQRCEFLLKCINKKLSLYKVESCTKFTPGWLAKWYRRDKLEAKLNEEKEIYRED